MHKMNNYAKGIKEPKGGKNGTDINRKFEENRDRC